MSGRLDRSGERQARRRRPAAVLAWVRRRVLLPAAALTLGGLLVAASTRGQDEPSRALPPGHPDISSLRGPAPDSLRGPAGPGNAGPRPRQNALLDDRSLPANSVEVVVLDADDRPLPQAPIELRVLRRSADPDGDAATQTLSGVSNDLGIYLFDGVHTGQGTSVRLSARRGAGEFSMDPFSLTGSHGVRARLHAYETTSRLDEVGLEVTLMVVLEVGENAISVDQLLRVTNFGPKAWVPEGLELPLDDGYQAFDAPESMGTAAAHELPGGKVTFSGTFAPGPTDLSFNYQVPLGGSSEQTVAVSLPPGTTWTRVVAAASSGMDLRVSGSPQAKPGRSPDGKRILVTERRGPPAKTAATVQITLSGLPESGPARWVALGLAVAAALAGAVVARPRHGRHAASPEPEDLAEAHQALLDEVAELERIRIEGRIVPEEYEAVHQALLDALARLTRRLEPPGRSAD